MAKVSKKNPLISVVVPVYKVEQYIHRCIDSILNQTYKNLEIILVDDGSPDNCGKICDDYAKKDKRIKVIHKKNGGLSDARNAGIKVATGEYIGFVDSDDWISKNMYEKLYNLFTTNDIEIASCELIKTNEIKNIEKEKIYDKKVIVYTIDEFMPYYMKTKKNKTYYYAPTKLFKKEILDDNQFPSGLTSEDVVGSYKALLKSKKIAHINYPYYFYYCNTESITGSFSKKDFDLLKIWDIMIEITKKEKKEYLEMVKLNRYRIDYTLLMRMAVNLKYSEIKDKYQTEYKKMYKDLKKNKRILLRSKIPFSRKLTLALICVNYSFFVKLCNLVKKIH